MDELNLETLLDQARIQAVLIRYATALDGHEWEGLHQVFVPEAVAYYAGVGDFHGRDAIVAVVRDFLEGCGSTQHLLGNVRIQVSGDQAQAQCYLQAIHAGVGSFVGQTMTVWGEYSDRLERRAEGWRIVERRLQVQHVSGDVGVRLKA
ncbi:nuclear transport factor 2 family protein [Pseudomonas sp. R3.Fl]|uniref:nuclear transport factor 2 family protein n=1 Tax=Pseudomonas TaxID=286 RepID=UPI00201DD6E2|nr:nuclear transport factor 2 family protein [Pseudomonas sp. R3.Fl]